MKTFDEESPSSLIEVGSFKIGRTKLNTKCHRNYKRKKHMLMSEFAR